MAWSQHETTLIKAKPRFNRCDCEIKFNSENETMEGAEWSFSFPSESDIPGLIEFEYPPVFDFDVSEDGATTGVPFLAVEGTVDGQTSTTQTEKGYVENIYIQDQNMRKSLSCAPQACVVRSR